MLKKEIIWSPYEIWGYKDNMHKFRNFGQINENLVNNTNLLVGDRIR